MEKLLTKIKGYLPVMVIVIIVNVMVIISYSYSQDIEIEQIIERINSRSSKWTELQTNIDSLKAEQTILHNENNTDRDLCTKKAKEKFGDKGICPLSFHLSFNPPIAPIAKAETSKPIQPTTNKTLDLDKLAYAVAMAETGNGKEGYGVMYNNAFGIKNGSIAPCERIGKNRMCIYNNIEESYEAFKKIWDKGYGGRYPTEKMAKAWTGNDRPVDWLFNVNFYYNQ